MINLAYGLFMLVGAATVGTLAIALIVWLGIVIKRVHRVAKDYHETAPTPDVWGDSNYFNRLQAGATSTRERLYVAERDASNARYQISHHVKDNKHTKTAKKVAIDKERRQLEKEQVHDRDVRCGDGM